MMKLLKKLFSPINYIFSAIVFATVWAGMALLVAFRRRKFALPVFEDVDEQTIHFSNGYLLRYKFPKLQYNYGQIKDDIYIDLTSDDEFVQTEWQSARMIRHEVWHYGRVIPMMGGGEDGELLVRMSLNKYNDKKLDDFIITSYQKYYDGPDGLNTEVRQSEMGKGVTELELGDWPVKMPVCIESRFVNGCKYLYWELKIRTSSCQYYAYHLCSDRFFLVEFKYRGSDDNKKQVISKIMHHFSLQRV